MTLRIDRRVMLALFVTLATGPVLHAGTDNWANAAGGLYSTAGNWSLNAPPGGGDLADFSLNDPYSVSFSANATASQLLVDSGQVTFDLGGHTANFTSFSNVPTNESVAVAQSANSTASLTISNGTLSGSFGSIGTATQNAQAFGNGTLNVTAGGHVVFHNALAPANALGIGEQGSGTLNIGGGGTANVDNLYVAAGLSDGSVAARGQVNLSGAGSSMTVNSQVFMGYYPNTVATMTVQNSASATSNQFYIGYDQGTAVVTVDHATLNAHFLVVGSAGSGQLTIQNGANVAAVSNFLGAGQIGIGYYDGGKGLLTITGAGSSLSSTGDIDIAVTSPLNPGDHSNGEFKVIGGGPTIHIGGNLVMGVNNPILADTIDSTGISPVEVSGSASLAGHLDVELSDFTPTPGQIFRLLDANNGITGSLTLTGPDASDFTIAQGPDTLDVIYNGSSAPEPASIAIFSVAGTLLLCRKRTA